MVTREEQDLAVKILDEKTNRQLLYYLDICTRCGICKDACHQYVATGDVLYLPASRAQLIRKVFRKYFTIQGKLLPSVVEATAPNDKLLEVQVAFTTSKGKYGAWSVSTQVLATVDPVAPASVTL